MGRHRPGARYDSVARTSIRPNRFSHNISSLVPLALIHTATLTPGPARAKRPPRSRGLTHGRSLASPKVSVFLAGFKDRLGHNTGIGAA